MDVRREEERRAWDDTQISGPNDCWRVEPLMGQEINQEKHLKHHYTYVNEEHQLQRKATHWVIFCLSDIKNDYKSMIKSCWGRRE